MKTLSNYPKGVLLGSNNGEKIYLYAPSLDCGWYWGFGYLGNKNCHYHVDGLTKIQKYNHDKKVFEYKFVNLYDGFKKHFGNTLRVKPSDLWTFVELLKTAYTLKETAEVLGRGGSHYTNNPCKDVIINKDEVDRINDVVLPQLFEEIYKILNRYDEYIKAVKEIKKQLLKGDANKIVEIMFENLISPYDLKDVEGITKHDWSIINSYYYECYQKLKKINESSKS